MWFFKTLPFTIFLSALYSPPVLAQQTTHHFTEGLYLQAPFNYGREAVYTDELLWHFYQGGLAQPQEGQALQGDVSSVWSQISTDTSGFFRPTPGLGGNLRNPNNPAGPGRIDTISRTTTPRPNSQRRGLGPTYLYLTYHATRPQEAILNIKGNSAVLVNGELHAGDPYRLGWLDIPVRLKKGLNELYVRGTLISAQLVFPDRPIYLSSEDLTLPDIVQGKDNSALWVGISIVNTSSKAVSGLGIQSEVNGRTAETTSPTVPAHSTRKIAVPVDGSAVSSNGEVTATISITQKNKKLDEQKIALRAVEDTIPYRVTFISNIDGSLQYYAVNPATGGEKPEDALFFSVHGAGVEALGQAQAYTSKDWGTLIAPTNRRPRGFNWEDWGRLDALEVLALAKQTLQPDSQRIYLTGHSMGGHGTWFLGATYPDKWAAIAPAAGYPTLKGYGSADGMIPEQGQNPLENILLRSSNQSDVIAYASNYRPLGVYILHGDADRTVSVEYARQMRRVLGDFHPDFSYYEYPGGSHWYSNESVDWKPLFDYFQWHKRKDIQEVDKIDFKTANPGISASYYWATIYQQQTPLEYSHLVLSRDVENKQITGTTENITTLRLDMGAFSASDTLSIQLDSLNMIAYTIPSSDAPYLFLRKEGELWSVVQSPSLADKGPHRNGTFKEAFQHRMLYVYGTEGSAEENQWAIEKARYDAESWYYRGNGAFDIIADRDFDPSTYADRNIILIGNSSTNSAWRKLLQDCPISVGANMLKVGNKTYAGNDLGGYFVWKKADSDLHSVGVITGTGIQGMQAATANQYFAGASGFPDYLFFKLDMLKNGSEDVVDAGFYTNEWTVDE